MAKATDFEKSFMALRKGIGCLGVSLPFILIGVTLIYQYTWSNLAQKLSFQDSISAYYYTPLRDIFVGFMFAIGGFLIGYKGYPAKSGEKITDYWVTMVAGISAIKFALSPISPPAENACSLVNCVTGGAFAGYIHYGAAFIFFVSLAVMCLWMFTKSKGEETPRKKWRNRIYRICGGIILLVIAGLSLYFALPDGAKAWLDTWHAFFWIESIGVLSFGGAWLVKGEAFSLLTDAP